MTVSLQGRTRCKTFSNNCENDLEKQIDTWFEENPGIQFIQATQTVCGGSGNVPNRHTAIVYYTKAD